MSNSILSYARGSRLVIKWLTHLSILPTTATLNSRGECCLHCEVREFCPKTQMLFLLGPLVCAFPRSDRYWKSFAINLYVVAHFLPKLILSHSVNSMMMFCILLCKGPWRKSVNSFLWMEFTAYLALNTWHLFGQKWGDSSGHIQAGLDGMFLAA